MGSGSVRNASARSTSRPGVAGAFRRRACSRRIRTAAAVAALAFLCGCVGGRQAAPEAQLPSLPDLSGQTEAVRTHLTEADRAARADPDSPDTVGALGLAYHADLYYEQAVWSYALAAALDPDAWKWTYYRALAHTSRGDAEQARDALRAAVEAAPEFGPAWWRLGDVDFKAGAQRRGIARLAARDGASRAGPAAGGRRGGIHANRAAVGICGVRPGASRARRRGPATGRGVAGGGHG